MFLSELGPNDSPLEMPLERTEELDFASHTRYIGKQKEEGGGDPERQYHLATDASGTGLGGVLFQIADHPASTVSSTRTTPVEQIVMFMSFSLTPAEITTPQNEKCWR
jgi:hypothetical protein